MKKSNSLTNYLNDNDQTHEHSLFESKKKSFFKSITDKTEFSVDKFKK